MLLEIWNLVKNWYVDSGVNEIVTLAFGSIVTIGFTKMKNKLVNTTAKEVKAVSENKQLKENQEKTETKIDNLEIITKQENTELKEQVEKLTGMIFILLQNAKITPEAKQMAFELYETAKLKGVELVEEVKVSAKEKVEEIKEAVKEKIEITNATQYSGLVDELLNVVKDNE